jgi:hypothetical protein
MGAFAPYNEKWAMLFACVQKYILQLQADVLFIVLPEFIET